MKTIITLIILTVATASCKKQDQPQPVEKIVNHYHTDTIHQPGDTVTVHDTVYINTSPVPLPGSWYCWKMETYQSNNLISTDYHSDWIFIFGSTTINQSLGSAGSYTYPITYNNGYVDISFTSTPTTYFTQTINNNTEYKLSKYPGTGTYTVWYLRK
jgi:hypothetical protein